MLYKNTLMLFIILGVVFAVSCSPISPTSIESSATVEQPAVGIANPASVFCQENGGKLEIRDTTSGQIGVCIFSDGSECEEWAYFRGECQPGTPPTSNLVPYTSETGGFSINLPASWTVTESTNQLTAQSDMSMLLIGYVEASAETPLFRSGMPAGEFIDAGSFNLLDQELPMKKLIFDGKTKVIEFCVDKKINNLRWFIWLDGKGVDYSELDISDQVVNETKQILASLTLLEGQTSYP